MYQHRVPRRVPLLLICLLILKGTTVQAALIDFEGSTLAEGSTVNQAGRVEFSNTLFAIQGSGSADAFGSTFGADTGNAAPFSNSGNKFIVAGPAGDHNESLTMDFDYFTTVDDLSFRVVDIDLDDVFTAKAYDYAGNLLQTITLDAGEGDSGTGDGVVKTIAFSVDNIARVVTRNNRAANAGHGIDNIEFIQSPLFDTNNWTSTSAGDWSDGSNWSRGTQPGSGAAVLFNRSDSGVARLTSNRTIQSLRIDDILGDFSGLAIAKLDLEDHNLTITDRLDLQGILELSGGGAVIVQGGLYDLHEDTVISGGTLQAETYVRLNDFTAGLEITDGANVTFDDFKIGRNGFTPRYDVLNGSTLQTGLTDIGSGSAHGVTLNVNDSLLTADEIRIRANSPSPDVTSNLYVGFGAEVETTDLNVRYHGLLEVVGGSVTTTNLDTTDQGVNQGQIRFPWGTITIDGGVFDNAQDVLEVSGAVYPVWSFINGATSTVSSLRVGISGESGNVSLREVGTQVDVLNDVIIARDEGSIADIALSDGARLFVHDDLIVGQYGTAAELVLSNNAEINVTDVTFIGRYAGASGAARVNNGSTFSSGDIISIANQPGSLGVLSIGNATVRALDGMAVGGSRNNPGGTGTARVYSNSVLEVSGVMTIWNAGTVSLESGRLSADEIDHANGGNFAFTGGELNVAIFNGNLVQEGGDISIGASPGTMQVNGNYNQIAGSLEIELGGTNSGTEFDTISVTDSATLAGDLQVSLIDLGEGAFQPQWGQSFEFLTANTVTGSFAQEYLPVLADGLYFDVEYRPDSVALIVLLKGDFDNNGVINGHDFLYWQRDRAVGNLADWQTNYGVDSSTPGAIAVPEPSGVLLACLGIMLTLKAKRRPLCLTK